MEGIQELLLTVERMQLSDYLDIIVVAALIYFMLPLIQNPGTMKIVRTIMVVVVITWITDIMKLHTLNWILNQFLTVGLVAFIVLFQPELRHMLDKLMTIDLKKLIEIIKGKYKPVNELDDVIEATADACETMRKEKTGALIIFTRKDALSEIDFVEKGLEVDAKVSKRLLENIFFTEAPLHDGAVIISDNMIKKAAVKLKLEPKEKLTFLPGDKGTRHHAAASIAYRTDAIAVVVSEEKKIITVICQDRFKTGGILYKPGIESETLKKFLKEQMRDKEEETLPVAVRLRNHIKDLWKEKDEDEKA